MTMKLKMLMLISSLVLTGCSYTVTQETKTFNDAIGNKSEVYATRVGKNSEEINDLISQEILSVLLGRLSIKNVEFDKAQTDKIYKAIEKFRLNNRTVILIDVYDSVAYQKVYSYDIYPQALAKVAKLEIDEETKTFNADQVTNLIVKVFDDTKLHTTSKIEMKIAENKNDVFSYNEKALLYRKILGIE